MVKNLPANAGDSDLIPGSERSPGEENGNHSSIPAWTINPMDRGAWRTTFHGVARVRHDLVTKQQDILRACSLPSNSKYRELIETSIYL